MSRTSSLAAALEVVAAEQAIATYDAIYRLDVVVIRIEDDAAIIKTMIIILITHAWSRCFERPELGYLRDCEGDTATVDL
jgi:hypothetical protein